MPDKSKHEWKYTLTLPRTDFPMRGDLPRREPEFLARWNQQDIYGKWQERESETTYILHDGPPYANGEIHIGHALNKVLKDIIVKYHNMRGDKAPYVPGWDCHGLPIETQVGKQLKKKVRDLSDAEFRQACRQYAENYIDIQRDAFQRLGIFADWQHPYLTMDYEYEAEILRRLADLVEKGYVFRRRKPVAWSIENRTALAEAELEYHDKQDLSVFVLFDLDPDGNGPDVVTKSEVKTSLLIWTTTPWTLPANLAVACNADEVYGLYEITHREVTRRVLIGQPLAEKVLEAAGLEHYRELATLKGKELVGLAFDHPFAERQGSVFSADFVSMEDGSGLVHIAPGHGADDYELGLREDLDIYCPVLDNGCYDTTVPEWLQGKLVWDANIEIADHLDHSGALLHREKFNHSYPHDWRSKKPIIFRATYQWFIGVENNGLRPNALDAIKQTEWTPSWGQNRIEAMVQNRPDWCISRQRRWGVPIAVPFCRDCGEPYLDADLMRRVAVRFEAEGADAWFNHSIEDFLDTGVQCTACSGTEFERSNDILDVWFDSGISWAAVCDQRKDLHVPADLYLEGSDQHRGWFQSSLLLGVALTGQAPYKQVLTHGFVVDGKGRKMSKSSGNVIDPAKIVKQYGAEILRLWIASEQYDDDMRISDEIIKGVIDAYRRIRNTFRFLAGNVFDFDPEQDAVSIERMEPVDRWMLYQLTVFENEVLGAYEKSAFHQIFQKAVRFCAVDLSALYLDVAKDRLYCGAKDGLPRRSAQTVVYRIAEGLSKLLAPILSFTSEELWHCLPGKKTESVFLASLQNPREFSLGDAELKSWNNLTLARDEVLKALEQRRADKVIGHSLDARVVLAGRGRFRVMVEDEQDFLPQWFITSQVEIADWQDERLQETDQEDLRVAILQAEGKKCGRCWQIQPEVGTLSEPELCKRCMDVVADMNQEPQP